VARNGEVLVLLAAFKSRGVAARVGEVGGVSLPGTAHGPCPRRRVDRIPSVPNGMDPSPLHCGLAEQRTKGEGDEATQLI
jgi:hypothetical protein